MTNKRIQAARGTDVFEKIEARTIKADGCWGWNGNHSDSGYPLVTPSILEKPPTKYLRVSRVVLARKLGRELLPGECACHVCDNPGCVNPDHLFAGTKLDNMRDAANKGRVSHGEFSGRSKLTTEDVLYAFNSPESCHAVAARLGVQVMAISRIRTRQCWARVTKGLAAVERRKQRYLLGSNHQNSKLSREEVVSIFLSSEPAKVLALKYGVCASNIQSIKNRQTWIHVTQGLC